MNTQIEPKLDFLILEIWKVNRNSSKGNQPFIGRTDDETEAPVLWPPDVGSKITADGDCSHEIKRSYAHDCTNSSSISYFQFF